MSYIKNTWIDRAVEHSARYLLSLVSGSTYDITTAPGTITQAGTQVTASRMNNIEQGIYDAQLYGSDAGGDDTYVLNLSTTLIEGMSLRMKVTTGNTGACSLSIDNGSTTKSIKKTTSAGVIDLDTGDIPAGTIISLVYDGTQWQLQNIAITGETNKTFAVSANAWTTSGKVSAMLSDGITDYTETGILQSAIAEFQAASMSSIGISASMLDSTHVIIVYRDSMNSNRITAIIALITGNTITFGTKFQVSTSTSDYFCVTGISGSYAFISYSDSGNSSYGTGVVLSITGTTINSTGTPVVYNSASTYITRKGVGTLDTTHIMIGYGAPNAAKAIVAIISGTTISSYGTVVQINASISNPPAVAILDSTHAVFCYSDSSWIGKATACSVSGSTITLGSEYDYGSNAHQGSAAGEASIDTLDSTHVINAYDDLSATTYCRILAISGTTITSGTPVACSSSMESVGVAALSNTEAYVFLGSSMAIKKVTISGTTISSIGASVPIVSASDSEYYPLRLSTGTIFFAFPKTSYAGGECYVYRMAGVCTKDQIIGINKESKNASENCIVGIGSIVSGLSGLVKGSIYYAQPDGTISTTFSKCLMGVAISTTELELNKNVGSNTWERIADTTLGAIQAQIDFGGIPSGYKSLRLEFQGLASSTTLRDINLRINDDAGANYTKQHISGASTTVAGVQATGATSIALTSALPVNATADFSNGEMLISNSATSYKTVNYTYTTFVSAAPNKYVGGGQYRVTTEINKISLIASGDSFAVKTRITLWGCK